MQGLIFDLDGTLIDSAHEILAAANAMLDDFNLPPITQERAKALIGYGGQNFCARVCDLPVDKTYPRFLAHYARISGQLCTVYPWVMHYLPLLKSRYRLAVCTNKAHELLPPIMAKFGDIFEIYHGAKDGIPKKPSAVPLLVIAKAWGLNSHSIAMIGDSMVDVLAAQAAGMSAFAVDYGYHHDDLAHAPIFGDFKKLAEHLLFATPAF